MSSPKFGLFCKYCRAGVTSLKLRIIDPAQKASARATSALLRRMGPLRHFPVSLLAPDSNRIARMPLQLHGFHPPTGFCCPACSMIRPECRDLPAGERSDLHIASRTRDALEVDAKLIQSELGVSVCCSMPVRFMATICSASTSPVVRSAASESVRQNLSVQSPLRCNAMSQCRVARLPGRDCHQCRHWFGVRAGTAICSSRLPVTENQTIAPAIGVFTRQVVRVSIAAGNSITILQ